jgi:hypothetical protein
MHFLLLQQTLVTLASLLALAFSFPTAKPQFKWDGFTSYPKPGDPIIEGSRCTEGRTKCPASTKCSGLYLRPDPVLRYCIHPARPNLREAFNCRKDSDCKTRQYCGQIPAEGGGYCKSTICTCGTNEMFLGCIGGSLSCELFNWRERGGGCMMGKGIYATCKWFGSSWNETDWRGLGERLP